MISWVLKGLVLYVLVWFLQYLMRWLIWHFSQSSIRTSIYFSLIVKSRFLFLFLEPTTTKQKGYNKGTTVTFDGAQTHGQHIMSQMRNLYKSLVFLIQYYLFTALCSIQYLFTYPPICALFHFLKFNIIL